MSGYTIIDADTHLTETSEVWTSRAAVAMRDRVPRIEISGRGSQRWVLGDKRASSRVLFDRHHRGGGQLQEPVFLAVGCVGHGRGTYSKA
jgi:hypothetical protein